MSETTSVGLLPDIKSYVIGNGCGRLIASAEARLVDADGKDVEEGERGELWIRGPHIMV